MLNPVGTFLQHTIHLFVLQSCVTSCPQNFFTWAVRRLVSLTELDSFYSYIISKLLVCRCISSADVWQSTLRIHNTFSFWQLLFHCVPRFLFPSPRREDYRSITQIHVSSEIHLSTLSLSLNFVFPPSGKIKYLSLHSEIHSEVLAKSTTPCMISLFPMRSFIWHKNTDIYLPFTEDEFVIWERPTNTKHTIDTAEQV